MLSIKTLVTAALAGLVPLASATPMVTKLTAQPTAAAGDNITVTLNTSIYVQNWEDFSIIWGLAPTELGGQDSRGDIWVGTQIGYTPLYGTSTPKLNSFNVQVYIPENFTPGRWLLVAAIPYLVGASGGTALRSFNSSITVTP